MKAWIINHKLYFIGAAVGAVGGYLYWRYVGCSSGTCMISSKPLNSTLYFAVLGALLFSLFDVKKKVK